jgi:hypothetical protein
MKMNSNYLKSHVCSWALKCTSLICSFIINILSQSQWLQLAKTILIKKKKPQLFSHVNSNLCNNDLSWAYLQKHRDVSQLTASEQTAILSLVMCVQII